MKRTGYLMQKMMTEENFIRAERLLGKNKPDNRRARYISAHADFYGRKLYGMVKSGKFRWHEPRTKTIMDSYNCKQRNLKIPRLVDQAVKLAWLNVAQPYILRKNYYYNCGSVPGAGQTRAVKGVKRMLKDPRRRYAATLDIRKFYDTCPHWAIRKGLMRVFKDKTFVDFAMGFVASMSDTGVGIAIGYPVSHWLANLVLAEMDTTITNKYPDVKYVRYMDDMTIASANKRHLRWAVKEAKAYIERYGMALKKWPIYDRRACGVTFLSYRFFGTHTLLKKRLMYRISRRARRAGQRMTVHAAAGMMSYLGILKYCDSYYFRRDRVYPYVRKSTLAKIISKAARSCHEKRCCCNR